MLPWEALAVYLLILVCAALLGWLPFRLLEYISIVDRIDESAVPRGRSEGSGMRCLGCGTMNDSSYAYCGSCGTRLPGS